MRVELSYVTAVEPIKNLITLDRVDSNLCPIETGVGSHETVPEVVGSSVKEGKDFVPTYQSIREE